MVHNETFQLNLDQCNGLINSIVSSKYISKVKVNILNHYLEFILSVIKQSIVHWSHKKSIINVKINVKTCSIASLDLLPYCGTIKDLTAIFLHFEHVAYKMCSS